MVPCTMWKRMERAAKRLAALCLLAWGMFLPSCACAATWLTDLPAAQASAKAEEKVVLLNFTGSDWCGWCIRLRNEVFSQPEFDAYANDHLVLVEADFPHRKAQSAALKQSNAGLSRQFHIRGYPTLIVLSADGQQLGTLGYQPGGPQAFIAELSRISGHKAAAAPPTASAKPPKANDPPHL